jgi:hypothetical protein
MSQLRKVDAITVGIEERAVHTDQTNCDKVSGRVWTKKNLVSWMKSGKLITSNISVDRNRYNPKVRYVKPEVIFARHQIESSKMGVSALIQ